MPKSLRQYGIPSTPYNPTFVLASTPTSIYVELEAPSHGPTMALGPTSTSTLLENVGMKAKYFQNQS
jgi:hypothetical protein